MMLIWTRQQQVQQVEQTAQKLGDNTIKHETQPEQQMQPVYLFWAAAATLSGR
jgi:hypothetical protein